MCRRSGRISPVESVDPNCTTPPTVIERPRRNLGALLVMVLRQDLSFRTPVVAVDPEQAVI